MHLLLRRLFIIVLIAVGLLLSACGPGAAPSPAVAPTFTPVAAPQASSTPVVTATVERPAAATATSPLPTVAVASTTAVPTGTVVSSTSAPVPTSSTTPPPAAPSGNAANGEKLFDSLPCSSCHDDTHPLPGGVVCPNLGNIAAEAARIVKSPDYHGTATDAAGYIHESIVNPNVYIVPGPNYHLSDGQSAMEKDFAQILTSAQIDDLVAYLMTKQ